MKLRCVSIFVLALSYLATIGSIAYSAETKILHTILYNVSETPENTTIMYDGFRVARVAKELKFSDKTGSQLASFSEFAQAVGKAPSLKDLKIGDVVGKELGDAFYADLTLKDGAIVAIEAVERRARPTIGVAWAGADKVRSSQRTIVGAILRNGGAAYLLPKITKEAECEEEMSKIDGFVMPGGTDVNPKMFGEAAYPHGSVGWDDVRDVSDRLTSLWAIEHDLPALWICRGEQMLNVVLGGALIQDVPSFFGVKAQAGEIEQSNIELLEDKGVPAAYGGDPVKPCMPAHYRVLAYGVNHSNVARHSLGGVEDPGISENSKFLLEIVGKRYLESVYTSHHQSVDPERLGKGLSIVAYSPDGIVEALEYQANKFALATQFHPECDTLSKDHEIAECANRFFKTLLTASCGR